MSNNNITLSNLLNDDQSNMLTDKAKGLTKADLHTIQSDPSLGGRLNKDDHSSIRNLAIHRANSGQTLLTYSHMSLASDSSSESDDDGGGFQSNW